MILEIIVLAYIGKKIYDRLSKTNLREKFRKTLHQAEQEMSPEEAFDRHHRHLLTSAVSMGVVIFNTNPATHVINLGIMLYTVGPMVESGVRKWIRSRTIGHDFLLSSVSALCLFKGKHLALVLNSFFYHFGKRMTAKAQEETKEQLTHLFEQRPLNVWTIKDGVEEEISIQEVRPGDVVLVNTGWVIPIDGIITEGFAMIDQYAFTGEAVLAEKRVGDRVFASTLIISGRICVQAETTGEETVVDQIGQVLTQTVDYKTAIQMKGEKWADGSGIPILALGGLSYPALGIEGTTAVLNSGYGNRIRLFGSIGTLNYLTLAAQQGLFIKDGRAFEEVPHVDTVVFDKTGTLTKAHLVVNAIIPCNGATEQEILQYAAIAEQKLSHPIAGAIMDKARAEHLHIPDIDDSMYHLGYGITVMQGEQVIRVGSIRFMEQEGIRLPLSVSELLKNTEAHQGSMILVAVDDDARGAIELCPVMRDEARMAIAELRKHGVSHISIVSGDHDRPTQALAKDLEADSYFAEVLPEQKAEIITRFQEKGKIVCFVGDGINDAIAMKTANVSVSLRGATTLATDLAQVVLLEDDLNQLETLFDLARDLNQNLTSGFVITLIPVAINLAGIFFMNFHVLTTILVNEGIGMGMGFANSMWPVTKMHWITGARAEQQQQIKVSLPEVSEHFPA